MIHNYVYMGWGCAAVLAPPPMDGCSKVQSSIKTTVGKRPTQHHLPNFVEALIALLKNKRLG
jgi:hypothetical protein